MPELDHREPLRRLRRAVIQDAHHHNRVGVDVQSQFEGLRSRARGLLRANFGGIDLLFEHSVGGCSAFVLARQLLMSSPAAGTFEAESGWQVPARPTISHFCARDGRTPAAGTFEAESDWQVPRAVGVYHISAPGTGALRPRERSKPRAVGKFRRARLYHLPAPETGALRYGVNFLCALLGVRTIKACEPIGANSAL